MRAMTEAMAAAIAAGELRPILFYEGEFASGTVRLWTGLGAVAWDGKTWEGAGTFLGVTQIDEPGDVIAAGTTVQLSGVPVELKALALTEARTGKPGRVWLGLLDTEGQVIADPVLAFAGRLDVPEISATRDEVVIAISYESRLIDLQRPREWRYTHESQQALHPGDRGFEYVAAIQDREIRWGS